MATNNLLDHTLVLATRLTIGAIALSLSVAIVTYAAHAIHEDSVDMHTQSEIVTFKCISGDWTFEGKQIAEGRGISHEGTIESHTPGSSIELHYNGGDVIGVRNGKVRIRFGQEDLANVAGFIAPEQSRPGSSARFLELYHGSLLVALQEAQSLRKLKYGLSTGEARFYISNGEQLLLEAERGKSSLSIARGVVTVEEPFSIAGTWQPVKVPAGYTMDFFERSPEDLRRLTKETLRRILEEIVAMGCDSSAIPGQKYNRQ